MGKVGRSFDILKAAQTVLKEPEKFGAHAVKQAQAIVEQEKGIKNVVNVDLSRFGDTLVTEAPKAKGLGKVTVKGAVPLAGLNPLQEGLTGLQQAYDQYGQVKQGMADAIAERFDVKANPQQPSAKKEMSGIIEGVADMANPLPFVNGGEVPEEYASPSFIKSAPDTSIIDAMSEAPPGEVNSPVPYTPGIHNIGPSLLPGAPGITEMPSVGGFGDIGNLVPGGQPSPPAQEISTPVIAHKQQPMPQPMQAGPDFNKDVNEYRRIENKINNDTVQNYQRLAQEITNISNEIRDGKIDPNAYMNKLSDGEKVGTVIGLVLSGLGSGLTGQPNMAMDFLNKQIERDIQAQTINLSKKGNLLHALQQQLGSLPAAQTALKAIYADQIAGKIAQAASKSQDPQVHARAQQAIQAMAGQVNPAMVQLAQRQAVMGALQSGQLNPAQAIPLMVPEHDRNKAFEELNKTQEVQQASAQIEQQMKKLYELTRPENRVKNPIQSGQQINTLQTGLLAIGKPIFGVLSAPEQELLKKAMTPTAFTNKKTLEANIEVIKQLASKPVPTPVLNSYGINVPAQQSSKLRPYK